MNSEPSGPLRGALDTNVYISALTHPHGIPAQLWRHAITRRYQLLLSPAIIHEVGGVLRTTFQWEDNPVLAQVKLMAKVGYLIAPKTTLSVIVDDPSDNRILECAVEGKAHLIVSGDHHLQQLKVYQGIPIIRPIDFLRTLGPTVKNHD